MINIFLSVIVPRRDVEKIDPLILIFYFISSNDIKSEGTIKTLKIIKK